MNKEEQRLESYRRTVAVIVAVVVVTLSFLIIRPFLVAILSAAALAYIFYPFYLNILRLLPKKLRAKELGSVLTCLFIVLLVLVPTVFVTIVLGSEARSGYVFLQNFMLNQQPLNNLPPFLTQFAGFLPQFKELTADLVGQLVGPLQSIIKSVPVVILNIFITVFSMYYFLKHGKDLYNFFAELVPLPTGRYKQIIARFDDLSRGMIMGQIVVALVQGVLAGCGFLLLGVPNPVLLGFLTAIISIFPLLGAAIVWVPVDVYLFLSAFSTGEFWRAIVLLVYGTFVISLIDNIIKPKIVGDRAKIHPLIILFGILGGIQLFGIAGILIGPLILTIFDVGIEIYKETL
ncbi:MAG: AI-2E family transporter [Candidatus Margulisbacteria bacterium]|jgi:predicted PurR-regulated permease PerM|nr:AI-2E family transporter [Candidatus Margulisiibacteriota bacterium]